jgi:hypothetical protein
LGQGILIIIMDVTLVYSNYQQSKRPLPQLHLFAISQE